ncbi:MAG: MTH938/NDUFAF3 family protein [Candidatus Dormiibacterota bacterium]
MRFESFSFGSIRIDGVTYDHDLVIDRGAIRKRKKKASKRYRDAYGHTPLGAEEDIPWQCRRLVVGTGAEGRLPVTDAVQREARRRKVELLSLPTKGAIAILNRGDQDTNAVLHVTC